MSLSDTLIGKAAYHKFSLEYQKPDEQSALALDGAKALTPRSLTRNES